jgi:ribosomal protein S18 acetylase RimI-like enzyme
MEKELTFRKIHPKEILIIKPLWLKLNDMHYRESIHFKDFYSSFTFEKRISKFSTIPEEKLFIEVIERGRQPIGYCISTIDDKQIGEIDSLYIEEEYRKKGLGEKLTLNSIAWFRAQGCGRIVVAVSSGHESVFPFYEKYGFYPRLTYLELRD